MSSGSVFRKWDLHVHTPESYHSEFKFSDEDDANAHGNDIWAKYINELEGISGIAVLGITDYFTIAGYKKVLEHKKKGRLQDYKLILPNIEFRLDKLIEGRRLNYHVIFSAELDIAIIEKEFLEELHLIGPNSEERKLTNETIEEIGRTLKKQHSSFRHKSDYVIGCENIYVKLEEIRDVLKKKPDLFGGKYLLVLPEEGWSLISWDGQGHLIRKTLLQQSHAIFSANPQTREWALGLKHGGSTEFISEFGSLKPCIHGSDAHDFGRLCKPDQDRFCWIKADCSFEGLKQILYEPNDRVCIQCEIPEPRKNIYTLGLVEIRNSAISSDLSIQEQIIPFNRNLVTVVGGKGNGKTALLDLIANCFEDRCKRNVRDKNSFVQRIEDEKPDLAVKVGFISDDLPPFSKELSDELFCQDTKVTYLPQGKIEEYSGNRQALNEKIQEIIFSNREVIDKAFKNEFDKIRLDIDQLVTEIDDSNREIYKLEEDTRKEKIDAIENQTRTNEGKLRDREDALKKLRQTMDEGVALAIDELKHKETELRVRHSKLESVKVRLKKLEQDFETFQAESNTVISDLNSELSGLIIGIEIPNLSLESHITLIKKAHQSISTEIENAQLGIQQKVAQLKELDGVQKALAELLEQIGVAKKDIEASNIQLKELSDKKARIKSLEDSRLKMYLTLLEKHMQLKDHYKKVIHTFSRGKGQIMSGIDFRSNIYFYRNRFEDLGLDILDQRRIKKVDIVKYADKLEMAISEENGEKAREYLLDFVKATLDQWTYLKETRTNYDLYRWIFDNYFILDTVIFFKGIPMDKLSIGQKGTVLLKLVLAEGDYPLIVDQPEENLDNKFIYGELVGAFREAKSQRQVIIATNNANLVVNSDAEQVIIASFDNNQISYKSGALEDPEIRNEITTILEGGEEAFRKRERKYGISPH